LLETKNPFAISASNFRFGSQPPSADKLMRTRMDVNPKELDAAEMQSVTISLDDDHLSDLPVGVLFNSRAFAIPDTGSVKAFYAVSPPLYQFIKCYEKCTHQKRCTVSWSSLINCFINHTLHFMLPTSFPLKRKYSSLLYQKEQNESSRRGTLFFQRYRILEFIYITVYSLC
jgi:hypothetical protein